MTYHDLITEFRGATDWRYDPWGSCLECWFDVAAELWMRDAVPATWDYSPGAAEDPREAESYWSDWFREIPTDALVTFGNLLDRYSNKLRAAGKDY